jgi:hypothetical protein
VRERKHNTSFVFLKGLANNPIFDHAMTGPTYLGALQREAADFHRRLALLKATAIEEAGTVRILFYVPPSFSCCDMSLSAYISIYNYLSAFSDTT